MENIHQKIAHYRKEKELTQEQLGTMLSVSGQAVSKWEKGESMPDILLLPQLCQIFGISADTLLDVKRHDINESTILNDFYYFAKEHGSEEALHKAMSWLYNIMYTKQKINHRAIESTSVGYKVYDERGMGFFTANPEYTKHLFAYDAKEMSMILRFLSDERTLVVLQQIQPGVIVTKDKLAEQTGIAVSELNEILLKAMEYNWISTEHDEHGKLGYLHSGLSFVLHMIFSALTFHRHDEVKGLALWVR